MRSSRVETEKRSKVTSIRLSDEQEKKIRANAEKKGVNMSAFIVDAAVNADKVITPKIMVKIQNITNEACKIADKYEPTKTKTLQKEVNELWQELK